MKLSCSLHDDHTTLTVVGPVDDADVPVLLRDLLQALDEGQHDVLLDMRRVDAVADATLPALTVARSRAKHLRHRIVVIDEADGETAIRLRSSGMQFRIPVFADPVSATTSLAADQAARARLTVRSKDPDQAVR